MPTPQTSPEHAAQEQVLNEFRTWMLTLSEDRQAMLGVEMSVEEPLRLLRGFASEKGFTLAPADPNFWNTFGLPSTH